MSYNPRGLIFEQFKVGDIHTTAARTITEADVSTFAGLSGDFNPLHTDAVFAKKSPIGRRIAHGMLSAAVATGLANQLGIFEGTTIAVLKIETNFRNMVMFGDTLTLELRVKEKALSSKPGRGLVTFDARVKNQDDQIVVDGDWLVLLKASEDTIEVDDDEPVRGPAASLLKVAAPKKSEPAPEQSEPASEQSEPAAASRSRFADRVVVVTGGGSGIGEATCISFAAEGARVAVMDIDIRGAQRVAEKIGSGAHAYEVDITDAAATREVFSRIRQEMGELDVLVNNAGVNRDAFAKKMKEADWDFVLDVNLKGTFLCSQASLAHFGESGGCIVNTASIGVLGNPGQANYSASKAGVIGLTRTLALEWSRYKIRVNCVSPGGTNTPMTEGMPAAARKAVIAKIPLGRFADPAEISSAHLFLCSDDAAYITGQVLFVDGGISVGL